MIDLILWILATIGLALILVDGLIMVPFKTFLGNYPNPLTKFLLEIMSCPQCSGFWASIIISFLFWLSEIYPFLKVLIFAFAGSFCSMFGAVVIYYFNTASVSNVENK